MGKTERIAYITEEAVEGPSLKEIRPSQRQYIRAYLEALKAALIKNRIKINDLSADSIRFGPTATDPFVKARVVKTGSTEIVRKPLFAKDPLAAYYDRVFAEILP